MRRFWGIFAVVIVLVTAAVVFTGVLAYFFAMGEDEGSPWGESVGVVELKGPIMDSKDTIADLEEMRKDDSVKAVVLRIDSPGGAVAASQEIFEKVSMLRAEKPVIASMGSLAASGGYYAACGATQIFANPGTATGSIGVKLQHVAIGDLMNWARIKYETLKSGDLKDMLPIDKPISDEARGVLQSTLDDIHEQFKSDVAVSRGIEQEKLNELADGRIFTGRRAKELGLVDELGGFSKAILRAGELGGIEGEPKLCYPKEKGGLIKKFFSGAEDSLARSALGAFVSTSIPVLMHAQ